MSETHVFLGIFDFGDDLDAVTAVVGLAPTRTWLRGDVVPSTRAGRQTHSRWSLHSGLPTSAPLESQLSALLAKLEPVADRVREAATRFSAVLWVAIYTSEVNPVLTLSAEDAARVGALGLPLDFDIYLLHERCPLQE